MCERDAASTTTRDQLRGPDQTALELPRGSPTPCRADFEPVVAGHREIEPLTPAVQRLSCASCEPSLSAVRSRASGRRGLQMRRLLTALRLLPGCGDKAGNGRALFMGF